MARFFRFVLVVVSITACMAEPARFRINNASARQEAAATPAKAPYPPAGLKPDIPFDLPTETTTTKPDNLYLPPQTTTTKPDNLYLPPQTTTTQPDNTYLPPESTYGPPATTYGPPTTAYGPPTTLEPEVQTAEPDFLLAEDDDDDTESVISVAVSFDTDVEPQVPQDPQRLVFGQRVRPLKSDKLRAIRAEPLFLDDGSVAYSAQAQNW